MDIPEWSLAGDSKSTQSYWPLDQGHQKSARHSYMAAQAAPQRSFSNSEEDCDTPS